MVAASSWVEPGDGFLDSILRFLPCLSHRALFGAVCKNWQVAASQNRPGAQLPWLLLPSSTAAAQDPCFFCLLCRTTHRAALPDDDVRGARCCGSFFGGWLILALQQTGGYTFHKLHNGWRFPLPEVLRTPGPDHRMVVHAARTMSRDEGSDVTYVAAIAARPASTTTIAFWCVRMDRLEDEPHGRNSWDEMMPPGSVADVIYYSGHGLGGFHVLTDDEEVLVYVPRSTPDGALATRLVTYRFPTHEVTPYAISRYLVVYAGELLMVARVVTPGDLTTAFHFAKFVPYLPPEQDGDVRLASWVPRPVIPSGIIVLGRCCSMSYPSYGIDFDGLYFLDDATSSQDEAVRALEPEATRQYPCSDMGWRPLLEHDIQRIFPGRLPSESSRAVWFFP